MKHVLEQMLLVGLLALNCRPAAAEPTRADGLTERVVCSVAAAARYTIPANILLAVAQVEGGVPGLRVENTNGTWDVGVMQFNSAYLAKLSRDYGISEADVERAGCYPYFLAAWRIAKHIRDDSGTIWQRVANYHSRTPRYNAPYAEKVRARSAEWERYLRQRYPVRAVGVTDTRTESAPPPPERRPTTETTPPTIRFVRKSLPKETPHRPPTRSAEGSSDVTLADLAP